MVLTYLFPLLLASTGLGYRRSTALYLRYCRPGQAVSRCNGLRRCHTKHAEPLDVRADEIGRFPDAAHSGCKNTRMTSAAGTSTNRARAWGDTMGPV